MLRKFVKALLEYSEDSEFFNPDFTVQEIPKIFNGWAEIDFNMVHHGAGAGCCVCIGPERYKINIEHCNNLQNKFKDSDRTKWRLVVAIAAIIFTIINGIFAYLNYTYNRNKGETQSHHQPEFQRHKTDEIKQTK